MSGERVRVLRRVGAVVLVLGGGAGMVGCASAAKPTAAANNSPLPPKASTVKATAGPRGLATWLPLSHNGEEGVIEGVPLIAVNGADLLVDGLRIGDVAAVVAQGRVTRLLPLFEALRSRRDAWLGTHAGEAWPGVVAYRFGPEVPAAVVKSVVLTAGYAACPNGSFLVETRGEGAKRVGRLAVDPLMVTEPQEKILTVEVKKDAFVVTWKVAEGAGTPKVIAWPPSAAGAPGDLSELASAVTAMWEASGLHREASDTRFDQVVLHVDDAVPYQMLVAVVDVLYGPRRSLKVGRHEERVPALNVNLAGD